MFKGSQIIYDTQKYLYNVTEDATHSQTSVSQFFIVPLPGDSLNVFFFFPNHCAPLKVNTTDLLCIHLFSIRIPVLINKKGHSPPPPTLYIAKFWSPGDNKTSIAKAFLTGGKISAQRKKFLLLLFKF